MAKLAHFVFGKYWNKDFSGNNHSLLKYGNPLNKFYPYKNFTSHFDGNNDYMKINDLLSFSLVYGTNYTFYFRFRTKGNVQDDRFFGSLIGVRVGGFELYFTGIAGTIASYWNDGVNALSATYTAGGYIKAGQWYDLVVVWESGNKTYSYVNGIKQLEVVNTVITGNMSGAGLLIADGFNSNLKFNGDIAEFIMFNEIKKPNEIKSLSKQKAIILSENI